MEDTELGTMIVGAAIEVHQTLGGPGLLESIYEAAPCHELQLKGFLVRRQVVLPVHYKGVVIKDPLFIDILVNDKVIIEVKALEENHPIHSIQLLTYLRLTRLRLGYVLNFGRSTLKQGISRVINPLFAKQ